jgi:membrane protein DedA with SNARE-associated domain
MAEILDFLGSNVQRIIEVLGYPGIALVMLIENLFPPIPSELVMPFAGFLVADGGEMSLTGVVLSGTLGSALGAIVLYWVGAWADERIARRFVRRYGRWLMVDERDLDRALALFARYGGTIVFVGRLIPLVRSLISLPAGMQRMPFGRFVLFTVLGSAAWTALLSYVGFVLGENWEDILHVIDRYQSVTLAALGVAAAIVIAQRVRSRLACAEC